MKNSKIFFVCVSFLVAFSRQNSVYGEPLNNPANHGDTPKTGTEEIFAVEKNEESSSGKVDESATSGSSERIEIFENVEENSNFRSNEDTNNNNTLPCDAGGVEARHCEITTPSAHTETKLTIEVTTTPRGNGESGHATSESSANVDDSSGSAGAEETTRMQNVKEVEEIKSVSENVQEISILKNNETLSSENLSQPSIPKNRVREDASSSKIMNGDKKIDSKFEDAGDALPVRNTEGTSVPENDVAGVTSSQSHETNSTVENYGDVVHDTQKENVIAKRIQDVAITSEDGPNEIFTSRNHVGSMTMKNPEDVPSLADGDEAPVTVDNVEDVSPRKNIDCTIIPEDVLKCKGNIDEDSTSGKGEGSFIENNVAHANPTLIKGEEMVTCLEIINEDSKSENLERSENNRKIEVFGTSEVAEARTRSEEVHIPIVKNGDDTSILPNNEVNAATSTHPGNLGKIMIPPTNNERAHQIITGHTPDHEIISGNNIEKTVPQGDIEEVSIERTRGTILPPRNNEEFTTFEGEKETADSVLQNVEDVEGSHHLLSQSNTKIPYENLKLRNDEIFIFLGKNDSEASASGVTEETYLTLVDTGRLTKAESHSIVSGNEKATISKNTGKAPLEEAETSRKEILTTDGLPRNIYKPPTSGQLNDTEVPAFLLEDDDIPISKLELSISARHLKGTRAMCVIYMKRHGSLQWVEYGRTERAMNNRDPNFGTKIVIPFKFGERQPIKFEMMESDLDAENVSMNSSGFAVCYLAQIIHVGRGQVQLDLSDLSGQPSGSFIILSLSELPMSNSNAQVTIELSADIARKFSPIALFGAKRPNINNSFIEICGATDENNDCPLIYETETVKADPSSPKTHSHLQWKKILISYDALSIEDHDQRLKFTCRRTTASGEHEILGEFETTLMQLRGGVKRFPLINPVSKKKLNDSWVNIERFHVCSLVNYLMSGLKISTMIGIDFSDNNGLKEDPNSLHNLNPSGNILNPYEEAISSIVPIMEDYMVENRFLVHGFPSFSPSVSNPLKMYEMIFHVNLDPKSPVCVGIDGILGAYRNCLQQADRYHHELNLVPIVEEVTNLAIKYPRNYHILFVLTTGDIFYPEYLMSKTVDAIKNASLQPVSIIMIGVGNRDFRLLELIEENTRSLERDVFKFLPLKRFIAQDSTVNRSRFVKEALAQIPEQLLSYMIQHDLFPAGIGAYKRSLTAVEDSITDAYKKQKINV